MSKECIHFLGHPVFANKSIKKKIKFKFIPKILMSKECIHFLGHPVFANKSILKKN